MIGPFRRKTASSDEVKPSFLQRLKALSRKPAPGQAEQGKPSRFGRKAKQKDSAPPVPSRTFVLIETGKIAFRYELTEAGAVEVDRIPRENATVVVFGGADEKDKRIELPRPMRKRALRDFVDEEVTERARMIRSSTSNLLVYARDEVSLADFGAVRVVPGALVVDHFVAPTSTHQTVFPIVLSAPDQSIAFVIIYALKRGEEKQLTVLGQIQVTRKPNGDLADLIQSFARKWQIDLNGVEVFGPDDQELRSLAGSLPAYPDETEFFGIPASRFYRLSWMGAAGLCVASVAGNVAMGMEAGYLAISANLATTKRDEVASLVSRTLTEQIRPFARAVSVDEVDVITKAVQVWQPNTVTTIDCAIRSCKLNLIATLRRPDANLTAGSAQLVDNTVDEALLMRVIKQQAPQGYRKQEIAVTGDGNVITVNFEQQTPDSPVFGLLPR